MLKSGTLYNINYSLFDALPWEIRYEYDRESFCKCKCGYNQWQLLYLSTENLSLYSDLILFTKNGDLKASFLELDNFKTQEDSLFHMNYLSQ